MNSNEQEIVVTGKVEKIIFSGDNGYKIVSVLFEDSLERETIVGYMNVIVSQVYDFKGHYVENAKYGEQFQVLSYSFKKGDEEEDIVNLLASKQFENIGKRTARKIYREFTFETLEVLKYSPDRVIDFGIEEELVRELNTKLLQLDGIDDVHLFLSEFEISNYFINEIYGCLNKWEIVDKLAYLKTKPYSLIKEIKGLTFRKIDEIYTKYNDELETIERYEAIILFYGQEYLYNTGDTILQKDILLDRINNQITIDVEYMKFSITELIKLNKLIEISDNELMLIDFYNNETAIARNIKLRQDFGSKPLALKEIKESIKRLEDKEAIKYSDVQKKAIINALSNNISIITGGPGTGKTTIIKAIVETYKTIKCENMKTEELRNNIILCAPTGRAAKRMNETSGHYAKTIHSLLEWDPYSNKFKKGLDEQLLQRLIVIDEFSMVDIFLARVLLQAIRSEAIIVIVGDAAQLESVNPGNVLFDLVESNYVSTVKLDQIFRQGEGSSIANLAKMIEENEKVELVNTDDLGIIKRDANIVAITKQVVEKSYASGYDELETQVLYPKYAGKAGIDELNKALKPDLSTEYIQHDNTIFQVGDKVMQLKNNYEKEIYNGDIGFVKKIINSKANGINNAIVVSFRDIDVTLTKKDMLDIKHAYAISIHKSQGSEFKVVIFPVTFESYHMLSKKLIYTAITRAKEKLIIIGNTEAFYGGLSENDTIRNTYLNRILD